jgi:hypothetical protein
VANHGPGTSGGGSSTASGETLKKGMFDLSLREDYTEFQNISQAEAEQRAAESGGFDAIKRSFIESFTIAYGITDDFQLSGTIGYYNGVDFIDAERTETGDVESGTANPAGLTDLVVNAKYRLLKGAPGNLSLIGGGIFPFGDDNVRLNTGEILEPSSQPGSGQWGFQVGLAYSRFLTSHLTIDASCIYTQHLEHDDFKVGDRVDAGVALAYRLTESIKTFPNFSAFGEITDVWLGQDKNDGEINPNSGGNTIYLTPGARVRFNQNMALTVAPSFPIVQNLLGDQIESRFKLALTFSFSF